MHCATQHTYDAVRKICIRAAGYRKVYYEVREVILLASCRSSLPSAGCGCSREQAIKDKNTSINRSPALYTVGVRKNVFLCFISFHFLLVCVERFVERTASCMYIIWQLQV